MIRLALLMMFASLAYASETTRIDGTIVTTGMTLAEVLDRVGEPSRRVEITNVYGAGLGERWEYYRKAKQYNVWVQGGKVVKVDES